MQQPQDWKRSTFISVLKKGNAKKCSNYHIIALILHASKVTLKILQARLQQHINLELPDVQTGFWKGRGTEIKLPTFVGSWRKQGSSRKTSTYVSLTVLQPLTVWIIKNCGKSLKRWEYQTTLFVSKEVERCMQISMQQLEPDMEQLIGSKLGKEYDKGVYFHPVYLTFTQSISWGMPGWRHHKLESRLLGEISTTSDIQMIPP